MEEYEIELAMKMISYAVFSSNEAQDLKIGDVKYHLRFFFTNEVMDEAQRRLTPSSAACPMQRLVMQTNTIGN